MYILLIKKQRGCESECLMNISVGINFLLLLASTVILFNVHWTFRNTKLYKDPYLHLPKL